MRYTGELRKLAQQESLENIEGWAATMKKGECGHFFDAELLGCPYCRLDEKVEVIVIDPPGELRNMNSMPRSFGFELSRNGGSGTYDYFVIAANYSTGSGQWFYTGGRFFEEKGSNLATLGRFSVSDDDFLKIFNTLVENEVFSRPWTLPLYVCEPDGGGRSFLRFYFDGHELQVPYRDVVDRDKERQRKILATCSIFFDEKLENSASYYCHSAYSGDIRPIALASEAIALSQIEECDKSHFFDKRHSSVCPFCHIGDLSFSEGGDPSVFESDPVVGWLVCSEGANQGRDYRLLSGYNSIGRDSSNQVCIAGDDTISRDAHARIFYDYKSANFHVVPGNGRSGVYLNDSAVLEPVPLQPYDVLKIGETRLMFFPFCGNQFKWNSKV